MKTGVPPCATDNGVVKPVREVISEFTPLAAALLMTQFLTVLKLAMTWVASAVVLFCKVNGYDVQDAACASEGSRQSTSARSSLFMSCRRLLQVAQLLVAQEHITDQEARSAVACREQRQPPKHDRRRPL